MAALRSLLRWRRRLGPAPGAPPARRLWGGGGGAGAAGPRRWRRELGWAAAGAALAGFAGYRLSERRREPSREPAAAEPGGARALLSIPVAAAAKETVTVGVCAPLRGEPALPGAALREGAPGMWRRGDPAWSQPRAGRRGWAPAGAVTIGRDGLSPERGRGHRRALAVPRSVTPLSPLGLS